MKLLFLHLSDIHCHYKDNNSKKLDTIVALADDEDMYKWW